MAQLYSQILTYLINPIFGAIFFVTVCLVAILVLHKWKYPARTIIVFAVSWLIICLSLFFSINYVYLHKNDNSNYVSLFTGWLGGLFTALLGLIAVVQNRTYNKDNEAFLVEQQKLQKKTADDFAKQAKQQTIFQNSSTLEKQILNLNNDLKSFLFDVKLLSLIKKTEHLEQSDFYAYLETALKVELLYSNVSTQTFYVLDSEQNSVVVAKTEQENLISTLESLYKMLSSYVKKFQPEDIVHLKTEIQRDRDQLTTHYIELPKKYYLLIKVLRESLESSPKS